MQVSTVTIAPAAEPITIKEAKIQLRIADEDHTYDSEIQQMVTDARTWIERRYAISIISQTRVQRQDNFYDRWPLYRVTSQRWYTRFPLTILYPPVQSISSFTYVDVNGVTQTMVLNTDYATSGLIAPIVGSSQDIIIPRIYPVNQWPSFSWIPEAIQMTYLAGFGVDGSYVPGPVKRAIKMAVTHFFENRLEEITGERIAKFEMSIDRIMSSYETFKHVNIYD